MKKFLALIMALCMILSLCACGAKEEANIEQEAVVTAGQVQDANAGISEDSPYRDKGFDLEFESITIINNSI